MIPGIYSTNSNSKGRSLILFLIIIIEVAIVLKLGIRKLLVHWLRLSLSLKRLISNANSTFYNSIY